MAQFKVDITPSVLRWAREESGYSSDELAIALDIEPANYIDWETKGENIPLSKLKEIANKLKRQVAVFFLPQAPESMVRPKDFRNVNTTDAKYSKEIMYVLRQVNYFREIMVELRGESYFSSQLKWLDEVRQIDDIDNSVDRLRSLLGINIQEQIQWKSDSEAYKMWRQVIENQLGILVFQFSMPINELQGFCLIDKLPYVIVTNSQHPYSGRIFTLFHELAHIIRKQSGMCLVDKVDQNQKEEFECNSFAGKFLIPKNVLFDVSDLGELTKQANKLNVSREAYLRRLKETNLISDRKFHILFKAIQATYPHPSAEKKKDGFSIAPEVKSKAIRGETFFNIVLNALNSNQISYSTASSALDLRVNRLLNGF